jgi:hypothetical protein
MGIVVLVIGTGTGEMSVHELAPIVGVQSDHTTWIPAETGCRGSNHRDLCFRGHGPCLGVSHCSFLIRRISILLSSFTSIFS